MQFQYVIQFQFHYGSIKILPFKTLSEIQPAFQFHYGSIKIEFRCFTCHTWNRFQFHYGSIKIFNFSTEDAYI